MWELVAKKYNSDGVLGLLRDGPQALFKRGRSRAREQFYRARYRFLGKNIVSHHRIKIMLDPDVLHDTVISSLQRGVYEEAEEYIVRRHLPVDVDVIELGSGLGFVSCVADDVIDDEKEHVVLEPNPKIVPILEQTKDLNDAEFTIIEKAYGTVSDTVSLFIYKYFWGTSTRAKRDPVRTIQVPTVNLRSLCQEYDIGKFSLILDIEGGEFDLIADELTFLANNCNLLIIEFHDFVDESVDDARSDLQREGFSLLAERDNVYVYENR